MSYNQRNDEIHDNIERIIWATASAQFARIVASDLKIAGRGPGSP